MLLREIQEYLNKQTSLVTGRVNIVKMAVLSKLIDKFNTIPIKVYECFYVEIDKLILKFIWNCKGSRRAKTILKTKNKVGGLPLT